MAVQWLRLHVLPWQGARVQSLVGGTGSVPGWGAKIPHATGRGQKNPIHLILTPRDRDSPGFAQITRKVVILV